MTVIIKESPENAGFVNIGAFIYPKGSIRVQVIDRFTFSLYAAKDRKQVLGETRFTDVLKNTGLPCTDEADFLSYVLPIL